MNEASQSYKRIGWVLVLGLLFIILVQSLITIALSFDSALMNISFISTAAGYLPTFLGYPFMAFLLKKLPSDMGEKKKMGRKEFITCIFLTFGAMYTFSFLGLGITSLLGMILGKEIGNPMAEMILTENYGVLFIFVVLAAPIIEELFFRKVLIDKTIAYGKKSSILSSAMIFGLIHGNLQQTLYAFVLGLFLGFIYVRTRNIIYPIMLHMMINLFGGFLAKYFLEQLPLNLLEDTEGNWGILMADYGASMVMYMIFIAVIIIATGTGVLLFIENRSKFIVEEEEGIQRKGNNLRVILFHPGMIIFTCYCLFSITVYLLS